MLSFFFDSRLKLKIYYFAKKAFSSTVWESIIFLLKPKVIPKKIRMLDTPFLVDNCPPRQSTSWYELVRAPKVPVCRFFGIMYWVGKTVFAVVKTVNSTTYSNCCHSSLRGVLWLNFFFQGL
jgi:hypothetical protein